jgi:hypothetical protein
MNIHHGRLVDARRFGDLALRQPASAAAVASAAGNSCSTVAMR